MSAKVLIDFGQGCFFWIWSADGSFRFTPDAPPKPKPPLLWMPIPQIQIADFGCSSVPKSFDALHDDVAQSWDEDTQAFFERAASYFQAEGR